MIAYVTCKPTQAYVKVGHWFHVNMHLLHQTLNAWIQITDQET